MGNIENKDKTHTHTHTFEIRSFKLWFNFGLPLVAQSVKNLPAMQETWVQSLGWEDIPWKREWQLTTVFLPGESHGQRSLAGYSPWGHKSQTQLSD